MDTQGAPQTHLLHLQHHLRQLLVVVEDLVELSHRVRAEHAGEGGHFRCRRPFVLAWKQTLLSPLRL